MNRDRLYLSHILEGICWIERFMAEGHEVFLRDRKTQDAVLRELQTLCESASRVSEELKSTHPDVPWKAIGGLRNVLVHDYLGVELDTVWEIAARDLPALKAAVEDLLRRFPPGQPA